MGGWGGIKYPCPPIGPGNGGFGGDLGGFGGLGGAEPLISAPFLGGFGLFWGYFGGVGGAQGALRSKRRTRKLGFSTLLLFSGFAKKQDQS